LIVAGALTGRDNPIPQITDPVSTRVSSLCRPYRHLDDHEAVPLSPSPFVASGTWPNTWGEPLDP
jgi:hypothetical protein